jgi:hypothetical protein
LRLPKPPPDFVADNWRPTWQLFEPSSVDKAQAVLHGKPVRVSVWDETYTSIEQARAFRQIPTLVLRIEVQDVLDVASSTSQVLHVVYEPLEPPDDTKPGAAGHAGIEGLEKVPGQSKTLRRTMLDALAARAKLVAGPD